jgi:hypothetical protein
MKTFEQFAATRRDVLDLSLVLGSDFGVTSTSGYVYDGNTYIERLPDGRLCLCIGNVESTAPDTDESREALERTLYAWCVDEGILD